MSALVKPPTLQESMAVHDGHTGADEVAGFVGLIVVGKHLRRWHRLADSSPTSPRSRNAIELPGEQDLAESYWRISDANVPSVQGNHTSSLSRNATYSAL